MTTTEEIDENESEEDENEQKRNENDYCTGIGRRFWKYRRRIDMGI